MPTAVAVAVADAGTRQKLLDALTDCSGLVVNYQPTLAAVLGLRPRPQICFLDSAVGGGPVPAINPAELFDAVDELHAAGAVILVLCKITDRILTQALFRLGVKTVVGNHVGAPAIRQVMTSVIESLETAGQQCLYDGDVVF